MIQKLIAREFQSIFFFFLLEIILKFLIYIYILHLIHRFKDRRDDLRIKSLKTKDYVTICEH